jgi:hypothetical protein
MSQTYVDAGYIQHLVQQLRALAPKAIIAIDRPSQRAAERYKREAPDTSVIYYTRQHHRPDLRKETLIAIAKQVI